MFFWMWEEQSVWSKSFDVSLMCLSQHALRMGSTYLPGTVFSESSPVV